MTVVVRVTEVLKTWDTGDQCPVFETDVQPARCAYQDVAQGLAANVSAVMLDRMGCEEGTWQTTSVILKLLRQKSVSDNDLEF
ncbi:lysM domain-containing protein [Colletotrichum tofieldiae]|nr:lysM domain-containing protein [Colletotrichum tofieldiae]